MPRITVVVFAASAAATCACWTSTTQPAPSPAMQSPRFDASSCPRDAIVESVCGPTGASSCTDAGDGLRSLESSQLVVTGAPSAPFDQTEQGTLRAFVWDRGATSRYRDQLAAELATQPHATHCCYSRCAALTVGTPANTAPPLPLPTPEWCIPLPPAGTTLPAPRDRRCPMGVVLDGALRAYVQTTEQGCCYDMR